MTVDERTFTINGQDVTYQTDEHCSIEQRNLGNDPSAFFCTACVQ